MTEMTTGQVRRGKEGRVGCAVPGIRTQEPVYATWELNRQTMPGRLFDVVTAQSQVQEVVLTDSNLHYTSSYYTNQEYKVADATDGGLG